MTGTAINTSSAVVNYNGITDEPDETVSLTNYAQNSDQIFTVDETAALQLNQADYTAAGGQSRVRALAAFNFDLNLQAAAIRQRFTTVSSDRKNHAFGASVMTPSSSGANGNRSWEYTSANWDGTTGTSLAQFPPMVLPANQTSGFNHSVPVLDQQPERRRRLRAIPHGTGRPDRRQAQ